MGRGRVQLRRIENKVNRQVTFSKRRSGLLKKAHEISVLCEADVAVIVFSAKGKLYEYSTNSNMGRILDRYEQYFYAEKEVLGPDSEQGENSIEFSKMKFRIESLQRTQRQLMGGDLESLNVTELQHLEQQLENALRKVRSRKNCMLLDSIAELEKKEILLHEKNIALEKEVKEMKEALAQTAHSRKENPRSKNNSALYLCLNDDPPTGPTVNTGTNPVTEQPIAEDQQNETEACTSNQLPRWMLCHVNRAG